MCTPGAQEPPEIAPKWPKLEQLEQQNKVVLNYNSKYNINTHVSIVTYVNNQINQ